MNQMINMRANDATQKQETAAEWEGMSLEDLKRAGANLLVALKKTALKRGHTMRQLSDALHVNHGYLLQLQHGLRETPRISDEVVRAAAAYLGVPVIVARVAAGQISLGDFAMQDERWEARVKNAIEFINGDPSYSLLLPPGLETLPMRVKVSIISLYESATGARLISYPEHLFTAFDQLQSLLEVDLKPRIKHTVAS